MPEEQGFVADFAEHLRGVEERFDALRRGLSPALREIASEFFAQYNFDIWHHPFAFPIALLPAWLARAAGWWSELARERVADYAFGACAGYLYIRIQDDIYDEPEPVAPQRLLLGNILVSEGQAAFARYLGQEGRFWALARGAWREWTEATAQELVSGVRPLGSPPPQQLGEVRGLSAEEIFARVDPAVLNGGRKLSLVKIPCFAVALEAKFETQIAALDAGLTLLQAGNQLINDFCSLERDLRAGFINFILSCALPPDFDIRAEDRVRQGFAHLARSDAPSRALQLAGELHEAAAAILGDLGQPWLGQFVTARLRLVEEMQNEFSAMRLGAILGSQGDAICRDSANDAGDGKPPEHGGVT